MKKVKVYKSEGNGLYQLTTGLLFKRNSLSPKVFNILNKVGNAVIYDINIGRTPVNALITGLIKVWSSTPYDKLFHLFIIMNTSKGRVLLEKNEVINMDLKPNIKAEYFKINNVPDNLTINQLLSNTKNQMGENKFIHYSAYDNNCQDFIINVLTSNGMNEGLDFVKQNTEDIFRTHPNLRKFANTITDVAGRANVLMMGGEINHKHNFMLNNNELLNTTKKYNIDCIIKNFDEFIKSDLNKSTFFICNHSNYLTAGYINNNNDIFYIDSYCFLPPSNIINLKKFKHFYANTNKILNFNKDLSKNYFMSEYLCILFLTYMKRFNDLQGFQSFMNLFNTNESKGNIDNDKILLRNFKLLEISTEPLGNGLNQSRVVPYSPNIVPNNEKNKLSDIDYEVKVFKELNKRFHTIGRQIQSFILNGVNNNEKENYSTVSLAQFDKYNEIVGLFNNGYENVGYLNNTLFELLDIIQKTNTVDFHNPYFKRYTPLNTQR